MHLVLLNIENLRSIKKEASDVFNTPEEINERKE
ncbi:UNVERIFIED_ORG: hypothetical protein ABIC81_005573 [Bacillus proteolyticus]